VAVAQPVINVQPCGGERRSGAGRHTSMRVRLSVAGRLSARRGPLLALAVVLSLAGCVTGAVRAATAAGCTEWAEEVSLAGQVNWRVLLESGPESELGPDAAPVAVGGVAAFAQTGVVHGLRLAGGQALWTYTDGLPVFGMWRWQGLVVVLSGRGEGPVAVKGETWRGRLTGLDAATGVVRWTLPVSGIGPQTYAAATPDGGLAVAGMLGRLLVVDMADGTVRWSRAVTDSTGLAAAAGLVLYGSAGRLTAYDDRTGVPRWTAASMDMDLPQMQMAAGLLLVSSAFGGTPVTAYTPATGRVAWTFQTPAPRAGTTASWASVAAGAAGVAVAVANLPAPGRLYLLDPATGRVRWQAATLVAAGPVLAAAGVVDIEGTAVTGPVAIVDRDAADGRILSRHTVQQSVSNAGQGMEQLVQAGQLALVQSNAAAGQPVTLSAYWLDDGSPAWQIVLPENVAVSPVLVPGQGVLAQPDMPFSGCGPVPA
jgi:outer membrane protein assembly factor BamB